MEKNNVKLTLSYDGTDYYGFQSQKSGNTIQDYLGKIISKINGKSTIIYCAGRTDSGVHAEAQVINFFTKKDNMNEENWFNAINSGLPYDIRINKVEFVNKDFNARKSANAREYWYHIINSDSISALKNRYYAQYIYPLNISRLKKYSDFLIGENDFTSFCALSDKSISKVRMMHSIKIEKKKDVIIIKFIANAFLHKMIRNIVGTLLMLHRFDKESEEMKRILLSKNRKMAGPTYLAKGLVFKKVYYEKSEI